MKNNKVMRICEVKENGKYNETFRNYEKEIVYCELSNRLIAKKINHCTWIKSIHRTPLYNGYEKIVVYYDNNCRDIFIIESK